VTLSKVLDGELVQLDGPVDFVVSSLNNTVLPAADRDALVAFQTEVNALSGRVSATSQRMRELSNQIRHMKEAISMASADQSEMSVLLEQLESGAYELRSKLQGDRVAIRLDIGTPPSVANRVGFLVYEQSNSTSEPTATHRSSFEIASEEFSEIENNFIELLNGTYFELQNKLKESGAPYTPYSFE
jgi:uncharacterized protein YukE